MKLQYPVRLVFGICILMALVVMTGCSAPPPAASRSGVSVATAPDIKTGTDGLTNEQSNITKRLGLENDPLAIKYVYVVSPLTGDILFYSSVKGKVTSSGKRLTPTTATRVYDNFDFKTGAVNSDSTYDGFVVPWGEKGAVLTNEAPQDDGTFGTSIEYLYWFDVRGGYHQQYVEGAIITVADQPIGIKKAIVNFEEMADE